MPAIDSLAELTSILEKWDKENGNVQDPVAMLERMAELVEKETEAWYKMDPDPFDDRHPGRADPNCSLGHLLKALFKNDDFMNKLVSAYLMGNREKTSLHIAACRLLLDVMPGLETSVVFQENEALVRRLAHWAETAPDPLRSYSTGLLAGAMEIQDLAVNFKDTNAVLVPQMLQRLHSLQAEQEREEQGLGNTVLRPFANVGKETASQPIKSSIPCEKTLDTSDSFSSGGLPAVTVKDCLVRIPEIAATSDMSPRKEDHKDSSKSEETSTPPKQGNPTPPLSPTVPMSLKIHKEKPKPTASTCKNLASPKRELSLNECSNSSWKDLEPFVIGSYCMNPLGLNMKQRLILQYLTPLGEYQELLSHVFEQNALKLIFHYIDLTHNRDVRLAFDALKYLAALLCHKKFAIEFIQEGGVERLLEVYRPSVAATGVSMCLYYLAYFEDAMERVCLLPDHVLSSLVKFVLWLLECSHESGRCHATMFFSMSFPFRVILDLFDRQDGLRKLFNVISTLEILCLEESSNLSEDEVFTSRQAARHVCAALKKYFETHLVVKGEQIRRSHIRSEGGSPLAENAAYKPVKLTPEAIQDNIELLLECLPLRMHWLPAAEFLKLGGVTLLLQLVAMAVEWNTYTGKAETIRCALDVLAVCTVVPRCQLKLCEAIDLPGDTSTPAISILLGLAEGEALLDPEVQKSSLNIVINCVCGPLVRLSGGVGRYMSGARRKLNQRNGEDLLSKLWEAMRTNNGIMVILKLLMIKTPITEADSIRALACKALVGLARSETVQQIVSKLPLFTSGQLQHLIKEPVLQDKRQEHVKFCKYATQLIERVSGKPQNLNIDASLDRIRKADVVAQTKIIYHEKELLQLIYSHLMAKGLSDTASVLQKEADLPRCSTPPPIHPSSPQLYSTPVTAHKLLTHSKHITSSTSTVNCCRDASSSLGTPGNQLVVHRPNTNTIMGRQGSVPGDFAGASGIAGSASPVPIGTPLQIKLNIINSKMQSPALSAHSLGRAQQTRKMIRQKNDLAVASPSHLTSTPRRSNLKADTTVSLDKIVTEYLREQHACCRNPVQTCPPFSLLSRHRCPDPKHRNSSPWNVTSRHFCRAATPRYGGPDGLKCDRKFVYSRFRPVRVYRDTEDDGSGCFTCCAFSACEQYLMLGTYQGELKLFNLQTGEEAVEYICHNSALTNVEPSKDGKLVLTSSSWGRPLSALWSMGDLFDLKHNFEEDQYMEFSKHTQDRIIGTKEETAHIYDVGTGQLVLTLYDQDKANNYTRNRATFNSTDDLVLNDGVLWDVNSGKAIHKFDKFNPNISGAFHPMDLEIVINSEVWDMRTFHLLHTVPALDQCRIHFNHAADVIYGTIHQYDDDDSLEEETIKSPFGSSFRTFDATDYSNIATIDVKKDIFDLATDSSDCYLAVIENNRSPETMVEESLCRLYEVGRLRDEDDDQGDDEEDEDDDAMDDDDDDDDDDADLDDGSNADDGGDDANADGDGSGDGSDEDDEDDANDDDDDDDSDEDIELVEDGSDDEDMDNLFFELL